MRSLVTVLVLLSAAVAWGGEAKVKAAGKVVAVEDDGSVWIYLPEVRASYQICSTGVAAPSSAQPLGQTVRSSLTQMLLGREVLVSVEPAEHVGPDQRRGFSAGPVGEHPACRSDCRRERCEVRAACLSSPGPQTPLGLRFVAPVPFALAKLNLLLVARVVVGRPTGDHHG